MRTRCEKSGPGSFVGAGYQTGEIQSSARWCSLRLADLSLGAGDRLNAINGLDTAAMAGLRQDGLLQESVDNLFTIGPDFAHDEVRRYAVARLLLSEGDASSKLLRAGAPRWALGAAQLAWSGVAAGARPGQYALAG